ncbi:hypothetical protein M0R45_030740 [Rubus argutus]|uniref:Uncharacterized protein n=1 Tax=Rubus argutus TaxID=59490 RepID=A0AAW1WC14_RUBAR
MAAIHEVPSITFHEQSSRDQLFDNIKEAEERLAAQRCLAQIPKPKIQRVPITLRDHENFVKYYEPRAVALGPFHHGNQKCELAEKFKFALAATYINESGCQAEDLLKIIEVNINMLRDCYDEESTKSYNDEALAQLFFLDGCSTLQFIYSLMHGELANFKIKRDQVAFAEQDLFLLENQLPYQVLKLLMSLSKKQGQLKSTIEDFVQKNIIAAKKKKSKGHKHTTPCHLKSTHQSGDTAIDVKNTEAEPTHLLELLRTKMLGPQKSNGKKKKVKDRQQSFRNIQELKAAGIHLKPSKECSLRDISFTSLGFAGFLSLPPISVDDSMRPKFLNLIAYEMCPDFENDFGISSYIGFLDSLIDHADDVKELRSAGVLYNFLGSDEEVAKLFNEIGTDLVPNSDIYRTVKAKMEKHYKNKCKTWMAQFCHEHFSSPWTILAFIGVLAALGLSGIQTWYTIVSPPSPCDSVCQYLKEQLNIK